MVQVKIIPATPEHAIALALTIRPEDRAEIWAAAYQKPEQAMIAGIARGETFTGLVDGVPVCMFGVVQESLVMSVGVPWLIASREIEQHGVRFLRRCKKGVRELLAKYDNLQNYVDARNLRAIHWLKWLGFKVNETPEPFGYLQVPFHKFTMEAAHV